MSPTPWDKLSDVWRRATNPPRRRVIQALGIGAVALFGPGLAASALRLSRGDGDGESSIWADAGQPLFQPSEWLNSAPLTGSDLEGKVVLVNFWTYSCINALRTLPYVRAWSERYSDRGLVVLGVHTPEFVFERELEDVRQAVATLGVDYPVVQDNEFAIWRSFNNRAWPAFFFVDAAGRVRHQRFGESEYEQSERVIQRLLSERGAGEVTDTISAIPGEGVQAAPDWTSIASPETYVGHANAVGFASRGGLRPAQSATYEAPPRLLLNRWGLEGRWTVGPEFATLDEAGGGIDFRFRARDLNLVLTRHGTPEPIPFRVTLDGAPTGADGGVDVDGEGQGVVDAPRMYQLVRQQGPIGERTFAIRFDRPGVRAYVFTFG